MLYDRLKLSYVVDLLGPQTVTECDKYICQTHYMSLNNLCVLYSMPQCACCFKRCRMSETRIIAPAGSLGVAEDLVVTETLILMAANCVRQNSNSSENGQDDSLHFDDEINNTSRSGCSDDDSQRATSIVTEERMVCHKCYVRILRKLGDKLSFKPEGYPDIAMYQVCSNYDARLHSDEDPLTTIRVKTMYEEYVSRFNDVVPKFVYGENPKFKSGSASNSKRSSQGERRPKSYRTFCRVLNAASRMCIFSGHGSRDLSGSLASSLSALKAFVSQGSVTGIEEKRTLVSADLLQKDLRILCDRFKTNKGRYQNGNFDLFRSSKRSQHS